MIRFVGVPVLAIIRRIHRSRLRQMMRGYRKLKRMGRLDRITVIKQALTKTPLNLVANQFSSLVMGASLASGELAVRQSLLVRVGDIRLTRALLLAAGKANARVIAPMPPEWRAIVAQHGFKVDQLWTAILWKLYASVLLLSGIAKVGEIALAGIASSRSSRANCKPHVYFDGLIAKNLPREAYRTDCRNIISWYMQWKGRKPDIFAIYHSVTSPACDAFGHVKLIFQHGPLPALAGISELVKYLSWAACAIFISTIDLIRGRWWHALLLDQAALAAEARILPVDSLAREYLFHNSTWIYRPLWTYEVERRGSEITFYFYSTNCEAFKTPEGYPSISYGYEAMNWPRYLVWDEYQADFVRRAVGLPANTIVVGPIWFGSSDAGMQRVPKFCVAVFDVTPRRASSYCILGMATEFYVPEVANLFCEQVSVALLHQDMVMLWKRKRDIGRLAHPRYRYMTEQLARHEHIVLVDPDTAADCVIESSDAVISMPFTSTALIAREMGKPSVYYDPSDSLQKDDRAAHGIPIISSITDLEVWLSTQLAAH